jgi:uncharacterized protein (UPF0147 family)
MSVAQEQTADQDATEEARRCADVANAVMRAKRHDAVRCACGIAIMATVVAGSDPTARTALARQMLELISELDRDVLDAVQH